MTILVDRNTRILVQGITGGAGSFHTREMLSAGTRLVGGVTPGKGATTFDEKIPVFDTVREAREKTGADASVIFVPAPGAADSIMEAADAGIGLIVCITEGIPTLDMISAKEFVSQKGAKLIGPNCPGIIAPPVSQKLGIVPHRVTTPGRIGVISRSGTLTYEAISQIGKIGLGQSTCVGIGGDQVGGMDFAEVLALFEQDDDTDAVVMIGEIGGSAEERAAMFIKDHMKKKVVAFIAGVSAPPGKRMGHAGAVISGGKGAAADKVEVLREAGVFIASSPADIGAVLAALAL
jgi:succinyl-CoA synthetase alpha subunit